MRYYLLFIPLLFIGCTEQIKDEKPVRVRVEQEVEKDTNQGVQIGPKLEFGPSYNFSTGKIEMFPSFDFGPRYNF